MSALLTNKRPAALTFVHYNINGWQPVQCSLIHALPVYGMAWR